METAETTKKPRASKPKPDTESEVLENIAAMSEADRVLAEGVHRIVKATAPTLTAKLWYGMPAYARDGKIVCFFQSASKFSTRYATLGFQHEARLDNGGMWPTSFALTQLTAAEEERITALIQQAVS